MRRLPTLLIAALLFGVLGCARATEPRLAELTVDEAAQKVGRPGVHFFDCNPRDVYDDGHVPTARWVDYGNVQARDLPPDHGATLVFYCANEH